MAGTQLFRVKKRDAAIVNGALGRHNRRDQIPDYAVERPGRPRAVELYQERDRAMAVLAAARPRAVP